MFAPENWCLKDGLFLPFGIRPIFRGKLAVKLWGGRQKGRCLRILNQPKINLAWWTLPVNLGVLSPSPNLITRQLWKFEQEENIEKMISVDRNEPWWISMDAWRESLVFLAHILLPNMSTLPRTFFCCVATATATSRGVRTEPKVRACFVATSRNKTVAQKWGSNMEAMAQKDPERLEVWSLKMLHDLSRGLNCYPLLSLWTRTPF